MDERPPEHDAHDPITGLVRRFAEGDAAAFDALVPLVYRELVQLAGRVGGDRNGTLQPTALVHETVLKLARGGAGLRDKQHFLAVAARAMRNLLTDHARRRAADKRGGGALRVTLDEDLLASREETLDLGALDEALAALERLDPRQARMVELRYFGGLENREIANLVGVSLRTVELDLQMARAFLRGRLG